MSNSQSRTRRTLRTVEHYIGGDTLHLPFVVPDNDANSDSDSGEERKDISNATIRYELIEESGDTVLSDTDDGVTTTITDATNGEFRVELGAGATDGLDGRYTEWIQLETNSGERQTWTGAIRITGNRLQDRS